MLDFATLFAILLGGLVISHSQHEGVVWPGCKGVFEPKTNGIQLAKVLKCEHKRYVSPAGGLKNAREILVGKRRKLIHKNRDKAVIDPVPSLCVPLPKRELEVL